MKNTIFALLLLGVTASAFGQTQSDVAELAKTLAPQIRTKLATKFAGQQQVRVAVFPFGNSSGKITRDVYAPNKYLQGELIISLRKAGLPNGTFVLDKGGLAREFQTANVDPVSINPGDPTATGSILQSIGVDVAVVGTIDIGSSQDANDPNLSKVNVTITLVFDDGTAGTLDGSVSPQDNSGTPNFPSPSPRLGQSDRFCVELFARNPQTQQFQQLKLITSGNPGPQSVLFCIVPNWVPVGTDQATYRVRLTNNASIPAGGIVNQDQAREKQRLYSVVLNVDGVNSFYQDQGNGQVGPVVRHPKNCKRWILSGPGQKLAPNTSVPKGYTLQSVSGKGHSVIDVPGFQKNAEFADSFLFVKSRESVAETIGITNDIGVIEAHFYPEKLPNDQQVRSRTVGGGPLGTGAGPQVENPVFNVKPDIYDRPASVVRIFYGPEQQCPIPSQDRIPVN